MNMTQTYIDGFEPPVSEEQSDTYVAALEMLAATPFEDRCKAALMALLLAGIIDNDQFDNFSLEV